MAIVLNNITSGYNLSKINANFQNIEDYINDKLLARVDTGMAGEAMMERDLDMNGNEILNYPVDVTNPNSLVTKSYVDDKDLVLQSQINKALRFEDDIPQATYGSLGRANSLQGYNNIGKPVPIFSMTETADLALKLASNAHGLGASLSGIEQGGTVQDALPCVYVDGFGADPTGVTDSTDAVLAAIRSINAVMDSSYDQSVSAYARVVFGKGTYRIGNIPLMTGFVYCGQGAFATRIIPSNGAEWAFTTTGTTNVVLSTSDLRMFNSTICDMTIGSYFVFGTHDNAEPITEGAGGILLKSCSYVTVSNVCFNGLDREAIKGIEVFDSNFYNIRMRYCGSVDGSTIYPALYLGPDGSYSSSNAINFFGLHVEHCAQHIVLDLRTRHVFFYGLKSEGAVDTYSSVITGANCVVFDTPELTWQRSDIPQWQMASGTTVGGITVSSSYGVSFIGPQCMSAPSTKGWYFNYISTQGKLQLTNVFARHASKIADGSNIQINGGTAHLCGPVLFSSISNFDIKDFTATQMAVVNGTYPILLSGLGCVVEGCRLEVIGALDNTTGIIGIGASATDACVFNNKLGGTNTYAIVLGNQDAANNVYDNYALNGASFTTFIRNSNPRTTFKNANGKGGILYLSIEVSAGATGTMGIVGENSLLMIQAYDASNGSHMCQAYGAFGSSSLSILQTLNSFFKTDLTGATPGDGFVYISKTTSSNVLTIHNYTSGKITLNVTSVNSICIL